MDAKTFSIPLTSASDWKIIQRLKNIFQPFNNLLFFVTSVVKRKSDKNEFRDNRISPSSGEFNSPKTGIRKIIKILLSLFVISMILIGGYKLLSKIKIKDIKDSTDKIELKPAKASQSLNKEFSFPLRNEKGEEVSVIKYTLEDAELRDEIIVKGKQAKSVKGRTFLILNLKVKNEFKQSIKIDTRDYLRLSVNGNEEEWLAPDIHNDPVEVQAISTKLTRIGFAIDDNASSLLLTIGEISADKERVVLELK